MIVDDISLVFDSILMPVEDIFDYGADVMAGFNGWPGVDEVSCRSHGYQ